MNNQGPTIMQRIQSEKNEEIKIEQQDVIEQISQGGVEKLEHEENQ